MAPQDIVSNANARRISAVVSLVHDPTDNFVQSGRPLLIVILAITVLRRPQAWVGYLNFASGAGAVLAATASVALVGRRLSAPILASACVASAALASVTLLAVAGASHTLLEIASRTLLQRSVPAHLLGRMFGVLEGLMMAGYAAGALLVPLLVSLGAAAWRCSVWRRCCRWPP